MNNYEQSSCTLEDAVLGMAPQDRGADIRKRRQKMIYEQKERQRFWIDMALSAVIVLVFLAGLWWFVDWIMEIHKAGGTNF